MTNEQLRLMLILLAGKVRKLADDVEPLIHDGERELQLTWIGEGKEPDPLERFMTYKLTVKSDTNYAMRATGEFTAVKLIKDFANSLEAEADDLVGDLADLIADRELGRQLYKQFSQRSNDSNE